MVGLLCYRSQFSVLDFHCIESTGHWKDPFPFVSHPCPHPNQYSVPHGDEVLTCIYHLICFSGDHVRQTQSDRQG